ncbi:unnamed protein product [Arctogadus glacialis]
MINVRGKIFGPHEEHATDRSGDEYRSDAMETNCFLLRMFKVTTWWLCELLRVTSKPEYNPKTWFLCQQTPFVSQSNQVSMDWDSKSHS